MRRHRTRQRESLLQWLRSTQSHPTAAEAYAALSARFPRLALGTVYRNLEVLVENGEIEAFPIAGRPMRYDGNTAPHSHFVCDQCGRMYDVHVPVPTSLLENLSSQGMIAERVKLEFYGRCESCVHAAREDSAAAAGSH